MIIPSGSSFNSQQEPEPSNPPTIGPNIKILKDEKIALGDLLINVNSKCFLPEIGQD